MCAPQVTIRGRPPDMIGARDGWLQGRHALVWFQTYFTVVHSPAHPTNAHADAGFTPLFLPSLLLLCMAGVHYSKLLMLTR